MYYPAELVIKNYKPLHLEQGMLFVTRNKPNTEYEYMEMWELKAVPRDKDEFIGIHGFPVELAIVDEDGNPLAEHEEIAWMDDGEGTEELRSLTLKDVNVIFQDYDGILEIDIDEFYASMDIMSPRIFNERIIVRLLTEEYEEGEE